eukprot:1806598-Rhodomonas_salina.1
MKILNLGFVSRLTCVVPERLELRQRVCETIGAAFEMRRILPAHSQRKRRSAVGGKPRNGPPFVLRLAVCDAIRQYRTLQSEYPPSVPDIA